MTKVDLDKDVVPADWKPISDLDEKVMRYCELTAPCIYSFMLTLFPDGGPENHENALVGLAMIAGRLEEEKVTAMLDVISRTLQDRGDS